MIIAYFEPMRSKLNFLPKIHKLANLWNLIFCVMIFPDLLEAKNGITVRGWLEKFIQSQRDRTTGA